MSVSTLCRLCLRPFQGDCKELINASGAYSEAYGIANKYFDPMLLISVQENNPSVLCFICWQHIQDFYYFQQTVFEAHSNLDETKELVSVVKLEVEQVAEHSNTSMNKPHIEFKHETYASVIQSCIEGDNDAFSSEDERPLMESLQHEKGFPVAKQKLKEKTEARKKGAISSENQKLKTANSLLKSEPFSKSKLSDRGGDTCNTIYKTNAHQKTLENDAFIAAWRSELDCVKCNAKFFNFTLLRKHFVKDHSDEKCYIVCCDRKFGSRYHIAEHIRLHMNPNAYRCEVCGKCSTNSRNLNKHIKELHSEEGKQRSLECPTCLKVLANKNSLRVHMETHETNLIYICQDCGKGFPSEQKRSLHDRYVHNASLICDQCGKTLPNQYAMRQHFLHHAGIQKRKWPCDKCSAELNSRSSLKRHKKLIHQDGSTVYVCSDCGKVATTEIALLTHKRNVHLSGRKHKCTLCDKAFKFPRVLREHIATHTGEDLYRCPHCDRTFKTNANMHHHRKKAHPKEWAEGRLNRQQVTKVDFNLVHNEVVI